MRTTRDVFHWEMSPWSVVPCNMATMLEFCARHQILPQVEHFPMSKVNEAIDHLRSGKARYRVVLDASK